MTHLLRTPGRWIVWLSLATAPVAAAAQTPSPAIAAAAAPKRTQSDSTRLAASVTSKIEYRTRYSFIDYNRNFLQYRDIGALHTFFDALGQAAHRKVKVVHIGDSHVQADIYPGAVRNRLQQVFGTGGRGAIFPYALVHTHAAYDYGTQAYGNWAGTRNVESNPSLPIGLHGASAYTNDRFAGFKIQFPDPATTEGSPLLKIWCRKGARSFDLRVQADDLPAVIVPTNTDTTAPYVEVLLPVAPKSLQVWMTNNGEATKNYFELYGLSLESPADAGILYHSVGINGANFSSILRQTAMPAQLQAIAPDLVVLDISGNEYYAGGLDRIDFEIKLRSVVAVLRQAAPNASILITCSQDIFKGYQRVTATGPAADLARRVALDLGCAFYDYYRVAGGAGSMVNWRAQELAKKDRVHLTLEGYLVKAELFTGAILGSYQHALMGGTAWLDTLQEQVPQPELLANAEQRLIQQPVAPATRPVVNTGEGLRRIIYTVRKGDNLGAIADRNNVYISQLRKWNKLRGSMIYPGQRLVIYKKSGSAPAPTLADPPPAQTSQRTPVKKTAGGAKYYTVRSGETLWEIAQKHHLTVMQLRGLNGGMKTDNIRPGQRLRVQ